MGGRSGSLGDNLIYSRRCPPRDPSHPATSSRALGVMGGYMGGEHGRGRHGQPLGHLVPPLVDTAQKLLEVVRQRLTAPLSVACQLRRHDAQHC
eukprot:1195215-Prorocentrum_minimum.AAC.1